MTQVLNSHHGNKIATLNRKAVGLNILAVASVCTFLLVVIGAAGVVRASGVSEEFVQISEVDLPAGGPVATAHIGLLEDFIARIGTLTGRVDAALALSRAGRTGEALALTEKIKAEQAELENGLETLAAKLDSSKPVPAHPDQPNLRNAILILSIILVTTGIAGLWFIAKRNAANPSAQIEPATSDLGVGKLEATVATQNQDDLDELIRAVNLFRDKLIGRGHLQSDVWTPQSEHSLSRSELRRGFGST